MLGLGEISQGRGGTELTGDNLVFAGTAPEQHWFFCRPQRAVNSSQIAGNFAKIS